MAVVFNWYRGTRAALAEAINDLDARLAAVEALSPGSLVAATTVAGSVSFPTAWVQDAIFATAVTGSVTIPTPTVRGSATRAATTVTGTAAVPAVTVTVP